MLTSGRHHGFNTSSITPKAYFYSPVYPARILHQKTITLFHSSYSPEHTYYHTDMNIDSYSHLCSSLFSLFLRFFRAFRALFQKPLKTQIYIRIRYLPYLRNIPCHLHLIDHTSREFIPLCKISTPFSSITAEIPSKLYERSFSHNLCISWRIRFD